VARCSLDGPVLARQVIPPAYVRWNRRHGAPAGRPGRRLGPLARTPAGTRWRGPFAWQGNNGTRAFEYPWAFERASAQGPTLRIAEIGGGLSGLQWVLARAGHRVVNIDPGPRANGVGWALDRAQHARLSRVFGAPVELRETTLGAAGLPDGSVDVLLAVSVLEHLATEDLDELADHLPRVLAPRGIAVLTVDLFLDVEPFTSAPGNRFGRNVDLRAFLERAGLDLGLGDRGELNGFPEFGADAIQRGLSRYLSGEYPALSQCLVAAPRGRA
jgi:SAM-dependent methyltransferase